MIIILLHLNAQLNKQEGVINMKITPIVNGVAVGAAVGTVCYVVTKASKRQRSSIRRNASHAVKSVAAVINGISSVM